VLFCVDILCISPNRILTKKFQCVKHLFYWNYTRFGRQLFSPPAELQWMIQFLLTIKTIVFRNVQYTVISFKSGFCVVIFAISQDVRVSFNSYELTARFVITYIHLFSPETSRKTFCRTAWSIPHVPEYRIAAAISIGVLLHIKMLRCKLVHNTLRTYTLPKCPLIYTVLINEEVNAKETVREQNILRNQRYRTSRNANLK